MLPVTIAPIIVPIPTLSIYPSIENESIKVIATQIKSNVVLTLFIGTLRYSVISRTKVSKGNAGNLHLINKLAPIVRSKSPKTKYITRKEKEIGHDSIMNLLISNIALNAIAIIKESKYPILNCLVIEISTNIVAL